MLKFPKSQIARYENLFMGEVRIKDYGDKANQDLAERWLPTKSSEAQMASSIILMLQQFQLHSQSAHWQVWCEQREGRLAGDSLVEEGGAWRSRGGGGEVGPQITF